MIHGRCAPGKQLSLMQLSFLFGTSHVCLNDRFLRWIVPLWENPFYARKVALSMLDLRQHDYKCRPFHDCFVIEQSVKDQTGDISQNGKGENSIVLVSAVCDLSQLCLRARDEPLNSSWARRICSGVPGSTTNIDTYLVNTIIGFWLAVSFQSSQPMFAVSLWEVYLQIVVCNRLAKTHRWE